MNNEYYYSKTGVNISQGNVAPCSRYGSFLNYHFVEKFILKNLFNFFKFYL